MFKFFFRWIDAIVAWFKSLFSSWFGVKPATEEQSLSKQEKTINIPVELQSSQDLIKLIAGLPEENKSELIKLSAQQQSLFWSDIRRHYQHGPLSQAVIIGLLEEKARCGGAGRGGALLNIRSSAQEKGLCHDLSARTETNELIPAKNLTPDGDFCFSPDVSLEDRNAYIDFVSNLYLFFYKKEIKPQALHDILSEWTNSPIIVKKETPDKTQGLLDLFIQKFSFQINVFSEPSLVSVPEHGVVEIPLIPAEIFDYKSYGEFYYLAPSEEYLLSYQNFIRQTLNTEKIIFNEKHVDELIQSWKKHKLKNHFTIPKDFDDHKKYFSEQFQKYILIPYLMNLLTGPAITPERNKIFLDRKLEGGITLKIFIVVLKNLFDLLANEQINQSDLEQNFEDFFNHIFQLYTNGKIQDNESLRINLTPAHEDDHEHALAHEDEHDDEHAPAPVNQGSGGGNMGGFVTSMFCSQPPQGGAGAGGHGQNFGPYGL